MDKLIELLHENECSLVLKDSRGYIRLYFQKGVRDLEYLLDNDPGSLHGAVIADKVIGKAAAGMMAYGGVAEVYADVLSSKAVPVLEGSGIKYSYGQMAGQIVIAEGDRRCPLEKIVATATTPAEIVGRLRRHFSGK